jgi:hypothetical protein
MMSKASTQNGGARTTQSGERHAQTAAALSMSPRRRRSRRIASIPSARPARRHRCAELAHPASTVFLVLPDHVRDYNKAMDYYAGDQAEIERGAQRRSASARLAAGKWGAHGAFRPTRRAAPRHSFPDDVARLHSAAQARKDARPRGAEAQFASARKSRRWLSWS